jgi:hypothetical protein
MNAPSAGLPGNLLLAWGLSGGRPSARRLVFVTSPSARERAYVYRMQIIGFEVDRIECKSSGCQERSEEQRTEVHFCKGVTGQDEGE